jgi:ABC-type dipeptide/oligopeptide/nickel transport system ATPase subunit
MTETFIDLENWFQERPKWLQNAARRIVQNGNLTEQDYTELLPICIAEAIDKPVTFTGLIAGSLDIQETAKPLRIDSISDVKGINALCPSKPLEFGQTPLCIVYGRTGTGKSGYVRLLKHACGARHLGKLLNNIYKANVQPQSASFTFTEDGQTKTLQWYGNPLTELRGVDIYDTFGGLIYVNEENEVAFEPWILRLFTQLTEGCEIIKQSIHAKMTSLQSTKPVFPVELANTKAAIWYANITSTTSTVDVDNNTRWEPEDEAELVETSKRLSETNPTIKATTLRRQRTLLDQLATYLNKLYDVLSDEHCRSYLKAKADASTKRTAADKDAKKVFQNAPLAGIGSESWRLFWEAARKYSEEQAYTSKSFPNIAEDARCVLCQRELNQESRDRFKSFESFVKSELQNQASQAEQYLQNKVASFPVVPTSDEITIRMNAIGITDDSLRMMVISFVETLAKRSQTCLAAITFEEVTDLPSNDLFAPLKDLSVELERQATTCDEDAKGQNRPQLESKSKELSARKWLNQQRLAIDKEITRLVAIHKLCAAEDLTNTAALSRRKSMLTDNLITNAYIQRFKDELKTLQADRLFVELKKTKAEVGRVYHRIALRNAIRDVRTSDILSEGEFRIVSLAAFLADTEGCGSKTTFIFDDPISSLDQVYEEATAQRLVQLSKSRQVIVFTHRLSLVSLLERYSEKENISKTIVCLSRIKIGDIAELPITLTKTKPTANRFLNERIKAAKAAFQIGDAEYKKEAKALCSDIRILIEQVIETDLLDGIVRRYNPEVQTKNKIEHLAKITVEDCMFIDKLMTSYSRYEHSQPDEAPVELPRPEEIEKDLREIVGFIEAIKKRKNS